MSEISTNLPMLKEKPNPGAGIVTDREWEVDAVALLITDVARCRWGGVWRVAETKLPCRA